MPATEAQIAASRANGARSQGPVTPDGRQASSKNALKHGLTSLKFVAEHEAEAVELKIAAYTEELRPTDQISRDLVEDAARMAVRKKVCAVAEIALNAESVRMALAEFEPPEDATEEQVAAMRFELRCLSLIADTKEAWAVRRYEAAASRNYYKALEKLERHQKALKAGEPASSTAPPARPSAPKPAVSGSFRREAPAVSGSFRAEPSSEPEPVKAALEPAAFAPRFESKWGDVSDPEARKRRPDPAKLLKKRR